MYICVCLVSFRGPLKLGIQVYWLVARACINPSLSRPVVRDHVDGIITVDDGEIIEAMRLCYEVLKVAVEPSGAIGLAAVLSSGFQDNLAWRDCSQIGIIISGGNVDLGQLWDSLRK